MRETFKVKALLRKKRAAEARQTEREAYAFAHPESSLAAILAQRRDAISTFAWRIPNTKEKSC